MKSLKMVTSLVLLVGCSSVGPLVDNYLTDNTVITNEKIFVGIPLLFGLEGSSVRLNGEWVLTAAHNSPILFLQGYRKDKDVFYHPTCDVALVREGGLGRSDLGLVYQKGKVTHVGYPIVGILSRNEGEYLADIVSHDWKDCQMSASSGDVSKGMSGGGVYNENGELVGITHGIAHGVVKWESGLTYNYPAIFTSIYVIRDWLYELTGEKL
tara:strand:+ start:9164 stop:9796 length:633 start_codon:yes stop_codon:yes gene_type:complete